MPNLSYVYDDTIYFLVDTDKELKLFWIRFLSDSEHTITSNISGVPKNDEPNQPFRFYFLTVLPKLGASLDLAAAQEEFLKFPKPELYKN